MIRIRRWEVTCYDHRGTVIESKKFYTRSGAVEWQDWMHAFGHIVVLTKHW